MHMQKVKQVMHTRSKALAQTGLQDPGVDRMSGTLVVADVATSPLRAAGGAILDEPNSQIVEAEPGNLTPGARRAHRRKLLEEAAKLPGRPSSDGEVEPTCPVVQGRPQRNHTRARLEAARRARGSFSFSDDEAEARWQQPPALTFNLSNNLTHKDRRFVELLNS
jgi:hypothetical protein